VRRVYLHSDLHFISVSVLINDLPAREGGTLGEKDKEGTTKEWVKG
jgi:hypothetical protein